jgi:hypothetical protein
VRALFDEHTVAAAAAASASFGAPWRETVLTVTSVAGGGAELLLTAQDAYCFKELDRVFEGSAVLSAQAGGAAAAAPARPPPPALAPALQQLLGSLCCSCLSGATAAEQCALPLQQLAQSVAQQLPALCMPSSAFAALRRAAAAAAAGQQQLQQLQQLQQQQQLQQPLHVLLKDDRGRPYCIALPLLSPAEPGHLSSDGLAARKGGYSSFHRGAWVLGLPVSCSSSLST